MKPVTEDMSELIVVNLKYIREHNDRVCKLMGAFELLRDIEEERLKVIQDTVAKLPDAVLVNIRKSQQDVWMYAGIIEDLNNLQFAPPMEGGVR